MDMEEENKDLEEKKDMGRERKDMGRKRKGTDQQIQGGSGNGPIRQRRQWSIYKIIRLVTGAGIIHPGM